MPSSSDTNGAQSANATESGSSATLGDHLDDCKCQPSRSQFDSRCPRGSTIWKIILLRRKTITNGCSIDESAAALALAQRLIRKHGLVAAELLDRAYTAPSAQPLIRARKRESRNRNKNSDLEL